MKILDIPRSGSYAGTTSSRNRFGQYVRNRRAPVQPIGTGRRAFIRAAFGTASAAWAGLTNDQQAAWDSFAASHPVTNSLGASVTLTGHQMFVAVATQRQNVGSAIGTAPPSDTEVQVFSEVILTCDKTPSVDVSWTSSVATGFYLLAFSPPLSPGRRFPTRFWQAQATAVSSTSMDSDLAGRYEEEFGTLQLGTRIFAKLTPVNAGGWTGTPTIVSAVVVAAPGP